MVAQGVDGVKIWLPALGSPNSCSLPEEEGPRKLQSFSTLWKMGRRAPWNVSIDNLILSYFGMWAQGMGQIYISQVMKWSGLPIME